MLSSSLHLQLLRWILAPLFVLVLFNAWQSYSNARLVAGIVTDRTLVGSAHTIAEQIKVVDGLVEAIVPPSALEMFASGFQDRVVYRVANADGTLLAGYSDVPGPVNATEAFEPRYFDAMFRGQPIRAVALSQPLIGDSDRQFALVIVGQTLRGHRRMIADLWVAETERQLGLVVIAAALAWFGLNRGLAPLVRLSEEIAARAPDTLDPIATDLVQKELRPLVAALNHSVERVRNQIAVQRRFIADAAHQLRTPLTLLKTQVFYGLSTTDQDEKNKSLAAVDESVGQMVHLTNQLLMLAKIEPGALSIVREPVDLAQTARHVLETVADRALDRNIELSFDATPVRVLANRAMLHELVMNIVDNALRYSPPGGAINATVAAGDGVGILRVADQGPGIPLHERERVFDRFYRMLGTDGDGSGLGLSIVREIAGRYDGTVTLADSPLGSGLLVEVTLPAAPDD
ncbi:sensor histidine kinase [Aliidongia dinghuensis]|uniref:histidine kinase n=1 Tax=Aliidongia dinghuensis TaxID=1867774 RepID=A0A8J2YZX4_9PROT|nr:sensor histidine kinase [Aliidongia dinghuensis]GGF48061.1 sensor histidine kinase [Aliidongia dinghuensis]